MVTFPETKIESTAELMYDFLFLTVSAIAIFQVCVGMDSQSPVYKGADLDADNRLEMEDAVSGIRKSCSLQPCLFPELALANPLIFIKVTQLATD